jgi:hypothetical protein
MRALVQGLVLGCAVVAATFMTPVPSHSALQAEVVGKICTRKREPAVPTESATVRQPFRQAGLSSPASTEAIRRTLLKDGTIELRYADGSRMRSSALAIPGTGTWIDPDGTVHKSGVPADTLLLSLPSLPVQPSDPKLKPWLEKHAESLLNIIRDLLSQNDTEVGYYLDRETEALKIASSSSALYLQISFRTRCITTLLTPHR